MGVSCSKERDKIQPQQEIKTISRTLNIQEQNSDIKDEDFIATKRHCTDIIPLFLMIMFFTILFSLTSLCINKSDIFRIINGYDDCGNVCGRRNKPTNVSLFTCNGGDFTTKKYLLLKGTADFYFNFNEYEKKCIENCSYVPNYRKFLNRCIPDNVESTLTLILNETVINKLFMHLVQDIILCRREILYMMLMAFAFSIILIALFRYVIGFVVWFILIGIVVASISGTIFLWIMWKFEQDEKMEQLKQRSLQPFTDLLKRRLANNLTYAIIATILTFIICFLILVMRKRIKLIVQLFKEAGKAMAFMPLLVAVPLLTFIVLILSISLWLYFSLSIESAGDLAIYESKKNETLKLYYKKDTLILSTRWLNLFAIFWISQFFLGCQHFVIAGAVAIWFFTRNKSNIHSPISTSYINLIRFHLGTVAYGSLIIGIVYFLRAILKRVEFFLEGRAKKYCVLRWILLSCKCFLYCLENVLIFLTRNAFIETAIYGFSFYKAGQQAYRALALNSLRVAVLNSVGDFVLFLGKLLVVVASVLIGISLIQEKDGVQYPWFVIITGGTIAFLISHCFITVYEMIIDTIFLCFCEDCEQNDGLSKPYFMSHGLMEFVDNSKKALAALNQRVKVQ